MARGRPRHCSILHEVNITMALSIFHNRFLVSQSAKRLFYNNECIFGNLCRDTSVMYLYNTQTLLLKRMDNFKREWKLLQSYILFFCYLYTCINEYNNIVSVSVHTIIWSVYIMRSMSDFNNFCSISTFIQYRELDNCFGYEKLQLILTFVILLIAITC